MPRWQRHWKHHCGAQNIGSGATTFSIHGRNGHEHWVCGEASLNGLGAHIAVELRSSEVWVFWSPISATHFSVLFFGQRHRRHISPLLHLVTLTLKGHGRSLSSSSRFSPTLAWSSPGLHEVRTVWHVATELTFLVCSGLSIVTKDPENIWIVMNCAPFNIFSYLFVTL